MLFVIYINDLPVYVTNRIKLYADDSKMLSMVNNWKEGSIVQEDLDSISKVDEQLGNAVNTKKYKALY